MKNHIEMRLADGATLADIKADVMHTAISAALVACYGNQTKASARLSIHRHGMRNWLSCETVGTYKRFEVVSLCVGTSTVKEMLTDAYREAISQVMSANSNNVTMTAKILNCQRNTVGKYLKTDEGAGNGKAG